MTTVKRENTAQQKANAGKLTLISLTGNMMMESSSGPAKVNYTASKITMVTAGTLARPDSTIEKSMIVMIAYLPAFGNKMKTKKRVSEHLSTTMMEHVTANTHLLAIFVNLSQVLRPTMVPS